MLSGANQKGWLRLNPNNPAFADGTVSDPSAGPTSGHYEFIFSVSSCATCPEVIVLVTEFALQDQLRGGPVPAPDGHFFSVTTNVVSPSSGPFFSFSPALLLLCLISHVRYSSRTTPISTIVGNLTITSTSPFDSPLINPNLLSTPFDILTMISAVKSARRFMSAPSWDGWITGEYGAFAQAKSDVEIEEYIRNNSVTVDHVCCTAAMGPGTGVGKGSGGVLNANLTVKGTVGLRVVDASAFVSNPQIQAVVC